MLLPYPIAASIMIKFNLSNNIKEPRVTDWYFSFLRKTKTTSSSYLIPSMWLISLSILYWDEEVVSQWLTVLWKLSNHFSALLNQISLLSLKINIARKTALYPFTYLWNDRLLLSAKLFNLLLQSFILLIS